MCAWKRHIFHYLGSPYIHVHQLSPHIFQNKFATIWFPIPSSINTKSCVTLNAFFVNKVTISLFNLTLSSSFSLPNSTWPQFKLCHTNYAPNLLTSMIYSNLFWNTFRTSYGHQKFVLLSFFCYRVSFHDHEPHEFTNLDTPKEICVCALGWPIFAFQMYGHLRPIFGVQKTNGLSTRKEVLILLDHK